MTVPSPRASFAQPVEPSENDHLEQILLAFRRDLNDFLSTHAADFETSEREAPLPKALGQLANGGVVIITDEGRGIARAVAADLRAMGHPVFRVRHGVSGGGVEGVNLTSIAAVAAMIERAREIGPVAAIVHLLPLRIRPSTPSGNHVDVRSLELLVHTAADELRRAAELGGASVISAHWSHGERRNQPTLTHGRELGDVRVRSVRFDEGTDTEVVAADVVREVLAEDPTELVAYCHGLRVLPSHRARNSAIADESDSHAVLLGAPHRLAWIELAEALIEWIGHNPEASLVDLAYTLTQEQPKFPFRIGLVARSVLDLRNQLLIRVERIAEPGRFADELPKTGRDWIQIAAAERFEAGLPLCTDLLFVGKTPRQLDLGGSGYSPTSAPLNLPGKVVAAGESIVRVMDDLLDLQRKLANRLIDPANAETA